MKHYVSSHISQKYGPITNSLKNEQESFAKYIMKNFHKIILSTLTLLGIEKPMTSFSEVISATQVAIIPATLRYADYSTDHDIYPGLPDPPVFCSQPPGSRAIVFISGWGIHNIYRYGSSPLPDAPLLYQSVYQCSSGGIALLEKPTNGLSFYFCPAGYTAQGGAAVPNCVPIVPYVCPSSGGWTLSSSNCTRPDCTTTQVRNASGVCIAKAAPKSRTTPPPELCKLNPLNAGTGDKIQQESIYSPGGNSPLHYLLIFVSNQATSQYQPLFAHGLLWSSGYNMGLRSDGTLTTTTAPAAVYATRATGQLIDFRLNNGTYISDGDIAHKLTRLTNGSGVTTGWTLINADSNDTETYDSTGKLLSIVYPNGLIETLGYDTSNRLTSVTDSFGHSLNFTYDNTNRVSLLTQPDGKTVGFDYDSANNLASITWPDGKVRTYVYENASFPNNLTGIIDENGARYATWSYDSQGRAISSQHAGGADLGTVTYGNGSTTITDALGTVRTITLSTILNVVRGTGESQPGGSGCAAAASNLSYDANGNVSTRIDFNGYRTTYVYDLSRNLETQRKEGLNSDGSSRPESRTVSTTWHSYWRLPVKVAEPLKLTTWVYNGDTVGGQVVSCAPANATVPSSSGGTQPIGVLCRKIEQATTDSSGSQGLSATVTGTPRTWTWTYNAYGQPLTADGPRTDVADTTTYTYYDAADPDLGKRGNLATLTNALGQTTQISAYDGTGRPLTIIDPNGLTTQLSYDLRGRLLSKNVGGELTNYQYDGVGQLTQVTQPDGASLNYTYDPAHRLTQISDGQGNRIAYTLDAMGNRTGEQVSDPNGALSRQISRSYDALNRLQTITGALQ